MGIHSGEPAIAGDRYVGLAVNRAARICSAAGGGQILISAATFALLADDVHRELELRDVGERLLKGIENPERLYEVVIPGGPAQAVPQRKPALRVVVADDSVLLREGLARLLAESGFEVAATAGDAEELLRSVESEHPAVAITDIKMPPTHTDEGLVAAERIRAEFPRVGVLVLSQYLDSRYAARLLEQFPERVGYLLKERVSDVAVLVDAVHRIAEGECVLDPTIVSRLMQHARSGPLAGIDERQSAVLALMAEGRSDEAIAEHLGLDRTEVSAITVEVFDRLGLSGTADDLRRIASVLAVLRS
jgi:serine/threonine-protein kinase